MEKLYQMIRFNEEMSILEKIQELEEMKERLKQIAEHQRKTIHYLQKQLYKD